MKVIIAGAGDIGFHIADLLATQQHDITLIDLDQDILDYASQKLDVITQSGDSASLSVLDNANVASAEILLAVTTSEKNNLVTAILAKKMGAKRTIARVNNPEYLIEREKESFRELGVDTLISPPQLAANEILRLVKQGALTDIFEFSNGKLTLIGLTLDVTTNIINRTIKDVGTSNENITFRPIAILRGKKTIIPKGDTFLLRNDHLYLITPSAQIPQLLQFIGKEDKKIKNVMMLGGNDICGQAAARLERLYNLKLVIDNKSVAKKMAAKFKNTLVIHGDPTNLDLLESEDISHMDAVISMTNINETNILTSLLAREHGVFKTIASVDNIDYTTLSHNIGIDTLINKKLIAANNISRFVRKGKIEAITTLQGVNAELIEYIVHKQSKMTKNPIKELSLPENSMIAGVIRNEEAYIPHGEFKMQIDDKVIVLALPDAIDEIENLFR